jgi:hypothetical protein
MSRSMHRSQGMGSAERKGSQPQYFITVVGEPAVKDMFDGVDTTWNRVGAEDLTKKFHDISSQFDAEHPEETIPKLLALRSQIASMKNEWAPVKLRELDEAVALCSGLALEAIATNARVTPGATLTVNTSAINRSEVPAKLISVTVNGAGATSQSPGRSSSTSRRTSPTRLLTGWPIRRRAICTASATSASSAFRKTRR